MGGFLGIGTSAEGDELRQQNRLRVQEVERSRRDAELRLAERKAKKGKETAKVKLGTEIQEEEVVEKKTGSTPSSSLGIGASKRTGTGIQL